jgi:transcriptional regulator with XRE-family HTH domain
VTTRVNLGRILRDARRRQQRTLRDLADQAGVSNAYLCQLEQSDDRLLQISWVNLQKVVDAYGLDKEEVEMRMSAAARSNGILEQKDPARRSKR